MRVVCIVQARMGSTRLPGKVMKKICGKTVLEHCVDRLKKIMSLDDIVIATTDRQEDWVIIEEAIRLGIKYFSGSETDVLSRYYFAAKDNLADIIVRVTSDCPLIDSEVSNEIIQYYLNNREKYDYVSNTIERTYPRGLDTEVFSFNALENSYINGQEEFHREHVTPYIWDGEKFNIFQYKDKKNNSNIRLTLDTNEDFELISKIYEELYDEDNRFGYIDILNLLDRKPELIDINKEIEQKKIK